MVGSMNGVWLFEVRVELLGGWWNIYRVRREIGVILGKDLEVRLFGVLVVGGVR